MLNYNKYKKFQTIKFTERTWPNNEITHAPIWCSVDLRDGNQALITPMTVEKKLEMFSFLLTLGFKEIEIGFPSASQIEYDFLRELIDKNLIPEDVTIQVFTQAREHLIAKTFEALKGVRRAVVHLYNSTSTLQRDVVFNKTKEEIKQMAVLGTKLVKQYANQFDGEIVLEYSPESFTGTELDYALEVCEAVCDTWEISPQRKVIINLPATVEMDTPNVYADQVEWMSKHFKNRENIILSVHPHNDRGTAVAAAELAMLAGADRVEGTLFGNGERTGNVDILILAYNMFSHGVNPELNLEDINKIVEIYEDCCNMSVPPRHPYAGKLVFTSFSGSHQDAIYKGMKKYQERQSDIWEVPYLPVDPNDLGRKYEALIRINSQSGKGGISFVMENHFGYIMPKAMHKEFADVIQKISEDKGEVSADEIMDQFTKEYLSLKSPFEFINYKTTHISEDEDENVVGIKVQFNYNGEYKDIEGIGNGPLNALKNALATNLGLEISILDYSEHALSKGSEAKAAAYVCVLKDKSISTFGVGVSTSITRASIRAVFSALNRLYK